MADPVRAAVVFSRSFRFVEWKFVIATPQTSMPFGDRAGTQYQAVREIDRRKWIYAFRANTETATYADIYEEIRVDKNGDMASVPRDRLGKGNPQPLGKTICLPRRRFGYLQVYRFFASRVRLREDQIKALKHKVTTFAPPVLLDPGDNLSVFEHKGQLLVPVVDPVTVALHLHGAFTAAADDIVNYTAAHPENSHRTSVERRRKKHLLATLLKSIIGEPSNTSANNLVNALKDRQWPLEDFLAQYDTQLRWRIERRDRMATYLTQWLQSDAIRIAAAASRDASKDSWPRFLTQWCQSITRLGESPPGRHYLDALLNDQAHFIHTYIWPQKKLPEDGVQAVRKGGMTIFEAWKTLAERKILAKGAKAGELVATLEVLLLPTGKQQLLKPIDQVVHYGNMLRTQEKIRAVGVIAPEGIKPARPFSAAPARFGAIVESVNLVLAISSSGDKISSNDPRTRQLALIGLVGSSLDAASAIGSLMRNSGKVVATMSFVSGVIDVYLGHQELKNAFKAGDTDTANAVFITTAGSTVGVTGTFMALAAVPGAQIVAVVGLLIVAIGSIYKLLVSKDPIEVFFGRCSWGGKHLTPGKPDWTPTDFKDWQGEKEFDRQLEALLNIICKVEVTPGDTFRVVKCKMGWLPPYATLKVRYQEKWRDSKYDGATDTEIELSDKGPRLTSGAAVVTADGQNGVKIELKRLGRLTDKNPHEGPYDIIKKKNVNPDLTSAEVLSSLIVSFDGIANVRLPHSGPASTRFQ